MVMLPGKRAFVLVENMYEDLELWYPVLRLREEGAKVTVVGPKKLCAYQSKHGYIAESEASIRETNPADCDALIIPGGYAPDMMRRDADMVKLVAQAFALKKVVAAICHAGWMLASAGIVKGKKVTCFYSIKDDMVHAGAVYLDQEVVVDGNLITSRRPADLPAFMRAVIKAMSGMD
jgi:protease I